MRNAARCTALLSLLGVVVGCGASGAKSAHAPTVRVTVQDFRIKAPKRVPAGDVVFLVQNKGPDAHEFIVVRSDQRLPLRKDDVTADEDAFEKLTVGVLEPGAPGSVRKLRVRLERGHYELLCNMSGHYLGGMRTEIEVT
jgi:uncharacterized cupredoxin-like copper-binding protein